MRSRIFFVASILSVLLLSHIRAQSPAVTSTTAVDADVQRKAAEERFQRQQELVTALAEKHGYKLGDGEPFKFIKDPQNEERGELRRLMQSSMPVGGPAPKTTLNSYTPFTHVLYVLPDGRIVSSSLSEGVTTLGEVFDWILKVRPYEFECPPNLLYTYMPGDWILLTEEGKRPAMSDGAPLALKKALNEQCGLNVRVEWKMVERPVLTIRGKYVPKPAGGDGTFLVDARRAVSYHPPEMDGSFDQFIDSIGYLLMVPIANEVETRPTNRLLSWHETGKYIDGSGRLEPEHEKRVLEALHSQLGYDLSIEPHEVKLLTIEPTAE